MTHQLLTHYHIIGLADKYAKNRNIPDILRKRLTVRILDAIHNPQYVTNDVRANVLTCHLWNIQVEETQQLNTGNAIRRKALHYGVK